MASKRDKVDDFIQRQVKAACGLACLAGDVTPAEAKKVLDAIRYRLREGIDSYRLRELKDIMDWKPPREV